MPRKCNISYLVQLRREGQVEAVRITQFYASPAIVARGDKALVCYRVENAKTVWTVSAEDGAMGCSDALRRVAPTENTTYTLTAEGADGNR